MGWLVGRSIRQRSNKLVGQLFKQLSNRLVGQSVGWLVGQFASPWPIGWLIGQAVNWLVSLSISRPMDRLIGWLVG